MALSRRNDFVPAEVVAAQSDLNLSFPLHRWRRNYVAVLKIAELELRDMLPLDRMVALLDWMTRDFLVAGPAAIFAALYFAPNAERAGVLKGLRSEQRDRVIAGMRNAAWDITHVSDFVLKASRQEADRKRHIFATADRRLHAVASAVIAISEQLSAGLSAGPALTQWWPGDQAELVGTLLASGLALAAAVPPGSRVQFANGQIAAMIDSGEGTVRGWHPPGRLAPANKA